MERRDFLKTLSAAAVAAGFFDRLPLNAAEPAQEGTPDLVAIRGEDVCAMFDTAIAAMGGMSAFIKPGQTVLIKPNIGWDMPPESGADTNPFLVGQIVRRAKEAGASQVLVFDHTCDGDWVSCYKRSGIRTEVEKNGGRMVTGNNRSLYRSCKAPKAKTLKSAMIYRALLESEVVINVPVLKHHGGAKMSCAMKNYMGVVWDRPWFHRHGLHQCIADSILYRVPDLNVVDAMLVMTSNGPKGSSPQTRRVRMNSLLLSRDIVAVDSAAVRLLGTDPALVSHIALGEAAGLGTTHLEKLRIKRIV